MLLSFDMFKSPIMTICLTQDLTKWKTSD